MDVVDCRCVSVVYDRHQRDGARAVQWAVLSNCPSRRLDVLSLAGRSIWTNSSNAARGIPTISIHASSQLSWSRTNFEKAPSWACSSLSLLALLQSPSLFCVCATRARGNEA